LEPGKTWSEATKIPFEKPIFARPTVPAIAVCPANCLNAAMKPDAPVSHTKTSKRLVLTAVAQLVLAVIAALSTGTVWLINGSMLRSSPPSGVQQFDIYLTIGFITSIVLIIVAAFQVDGTRRSGFR
jgi:hypothetical protein